MIERILSAPDNPRVDTLANELLREFQRGFSIERLRTLLRSEDPRVVKTAVWIASELGEACRPLVQDTSKLLGHSEKGIRFDALDCLHWASPEQGAEVARGVQLLRDPDAGVRWKAMDFVARGSSAQLMAALTFFREDARDNELLDGLEWLLSREKSTSIDAATALRASSPLLRKFAAVRATQLSDREREELLSLASSGEDLDVRRFADAKRRSLP